MKVIQLLGGACLIAAMTVAGWQWNRVKHLHAENLALQAELQSLKEQITADSESEKQKREASVQRLQKDALDVQKLRNEVSQLRLGARETEKLKAENQALRTALSAAATAAGTNTGVQLAEKSKDYFTRENWAFSGYATPEAALVSAISAMKDGNPKAYLDSLAPEEQQRMAKVWADKTEQEVAAKHQSDVSTISGMRLLGRQDLSPSEAVFSVYIEGPDRMEKVRMVLVGEDWKFGGFIRNASK